MPYILLLFFLLVPACTSLANRALLHPNQQALQIPGTQVDLGDGQLGFYLECGEGPLLGLVLCLHGNGGRAEHQLFHSIDLLEQAHEGWPGRLGVLAVEYPGFGRARGEAELARLGEVALAGYQCLRRKHPELPILVHGRSMGTVPALYLGSVIPAADRCGLLLEKPPILFEQILWQHGWWNLYLLSLPAALGLPDSVRSENLARRAQGHPALFLVCDQDQVTPPRYGEALARTYRGPRRILLARGAHRHLITPARCPQLRSGMCWLWERSRRDRYSSPASDQTKR